MQYLLLLNSTLTLRSQRNQRLYLDWMPSMFAQNTIVIKHIFYTSKTRMSVWQWTHTCKHISPELMETTWNLLWHKQSTKHMCVLWRTFKTIEVVCNSHEGNCENIWPKTRSLEAISFAVIYYYWGICVFYKAISGWNVYTPLYEMEIVKMEPHTCSHY